MIEKLTFAVVALTVLIAADFPDPVLTPGAVATTDVREVCSRTDGETYSREHRRTTSAMRHEVLRLYGVRGRFRGEIDHRVPLCLGGADAIENLWPQDDYRSKDRLEAAACRAVCEGRVSLPDAQATFFGDWR